ncbi:UNVERIFIED_CONTAM: Serine/threonine-protein phosphatase BSL3 [Sesamum angustifolium]|uniref:Serine/threonine-protein phosphatase n=1 Tax=Sesamum angustifolium TaxID=2727405 RepID=A0AAW2QRF5_9LAMI
MDVDSAMATEPDHDPSEQPTTANGADQPTESESESSPPQQQEQQQTNNSSIINNSSNSGGGAGPGPVVAGPRCAPTYSVVNAIIEKKEDGPGPRCGHTLTAVPAVGEEGSPGYIGPRLILFGGATALEGNSAASGTPSSAGSAGIRLAGATADVHCYDVLTNKWSRITPIGEPPTPRAAHVATAVGTMVVIQGGIGPAGLSAEDLHVLDLTQQRPRWHRVVVQGPGPGPRYGHVMALVGQRYLMAIGGNDGKRPLADVWALDTAAKPYEWRKLEPEGEGPPPCMYATASARSDGLLLLCGGRDANSVVVVAAETGGALGGMVRQLSIDQFENEGRRVSYGTPESATAARKLLDRQMSINSVPKKVIAHLLKPRGWKPPVRRQFFLDCNEIADLCDSAERIFASEPSVLQLKAPIKIFGDLHGQFGDLMRLFDEYGSPSTAGDIAYIDYLFLGDYVDRGQHSLETITLLLALKVEHPHQIHLIRGNHEAADINALFGFRIECIERMVMEFGHGIG